MNFMIDIIKTAYSYADSITDKIVDLIISKPKEIKDTEFNTMQKVIGVAASYGVCYEIFVLGIRSVELLNRMSASQNLIQATVTFVQAAAEFAVAPTTAIQTLTATGNIPLIAAGAVVLICSTVGAKVAIRAAGHVYNHFSDSSEQIEGKTNDRTEVVNSVDVDLTSERKVSSHTAQPVYQTHQTNALTFSKYKEKTVNDFTDQVYSSNVDSKEVETPRFIGETRIVAGRTTP